MSYRHINQYYVAMTDPRVPLAMRNSCAAHGLPAIDLTDEFLGIPGFPPAVYIRAPTRMRTSILGRPLTFSDMILPGRNNKPDPIAGGGYNVDRHNIGSSPSIDEGWIREGHPEDEGRGYYQITWGSVRAPLGIASNLCAICGPCISEVMQASQRMEPTFAVTGEAVGLGMAAANENNTTTGALSYDKLRPLLDAAGAKLNYA
jgi:hypothetical protein